MLYILSSTICIWVIFFNGAEKLENAVLGYFEFGQLAEKALYIKISAWLGLIFSLFILINGMH
ncbi:hypothetical protein CN03_03520 [Thalassolituus oleivorans]|jgi:hypothetical protein|nr:hypothetical protein CN03_03520 [Thalassolituus oleivorans]